MSDRKPHHSWLHFDENNDVVEPSSGAVVKEASLRIGPYNATCFAYVPGIPWEVSWGDGCCIDSSVDHECMVDSQFAAEDAILRLLTEAMEELKSPLR